MPCIETNDHTRLFYRTWGTGKPVVFIHGFTLSSAIWEYQMAAFPNDLRAIAYDRRGHGRSDQPGSGYDYDTLADDLACLMEQLDLREATLVAHSMGAGEVARYLSRHGSGRVARAVLVAPATPCVRQRPGDQDGWTDEAFTHAIAGMTTDRPRYYASMAPAFFDQDASPEMVQWVLAIGLQTSLLAAIGCTRAQFETDFTDELGAFTMPTLIVHGDADISQPVERSGRKTAQAIPGSRLEIYEGAPHGLFLTHKERFTRDLLGFVRNDARTMAA